MALTYETLKRIQKAYDMIFSGEVDSMEVGKHIIDDTMYINVQEYETKTEGLFEAHRKYIDIQYVIDGEEIIRIAPVSELEIVNPFNPDKDVELGNVKDSYAVHVGPKQFRVLLPEEAHRPGLCVEKPSHVKKAIFKILI